MNADSAAAQPGRGRNWWSSSAMYLCIAVAFVGIYIVAGGAQSRVSRVPADLELGAESFPAIVLGHQVGSEAELAARIAGEPVGSTVYLRSLDGELLGNFMTVRAYSPFHKLVVRLNGFLFLAVSLIVFAPRIDKLPARDLFWACTLYGLAVMIGGIYAPGRDVWPAALLPAARIVSLVILPTLLLHIGLTFPRRAAILDRHRRLMPTVTVVGLAIAAWQILVWSRWFAGNSADAWSAIAPARTAGGIFLAAVFGTGCLGLVRGSMQAEQEWEREQTKWLLWGIAMGAVPFIFLHALPVSLGLPLFLPVEVARLFSLTIPIAFSFTVIRYRFLDVDIIIRRSLLYFLLASLLVGVYALLGIIIGQRIEQRWPETGPFVPIIATLVSALLFAPTRRAVGTLIDRLFFKIRYDHTRALASFRQRLLKATDQQGIATLLARFLRHNLRPTVISVSLQHEDRRFNGGAEFPREGALPREMDTAATTEMTARADIETLFPVEWAAAGFALAQRVQVEGDSLGTVLLGPKRTGRRFVADDLDLVAAAADEAGRRLRRINLEEDFVDQVVARHQVEEMNRFRTQFFAQFAHDLRSPLTSINWGARNLLDGVVGDFTEAQRRYLEGIETSARQLVRLVNNLLEVTRLESGMPEIEFSPVSAKDIVQESVSKLSATAAAKRVEIVARTGETPPVQSHPEKLLEVMDNLIENAIRYSPPDSTVEVDAMAVGHEVELRIQDRGPGLDPEEIDTIFEPYRQGSPSPHSTQHGFGLGLFVVRSWIERMDGRVEATNRPGGGACFRIRIPMATQALEQLSEENT